MCGSADVRVDCGPWAWKRASIRRRSVFRAVNQAHRRADVSPRRLRVLNASPWLGTVLPHHSIQTCIKGGLAQRRIEQGQTGQTLLTTAVPEQDLSSSSLWTTPLPLPPFQP